MKYLYTITIISLLALSGCSNSSQTYLSGSNGYENLKPIHTHSSLPEMLAWLPEYPEKPTEELYEQFTNGWHITFTVPNSYIIAKNAWVAILQEHAWNIDDQFDKGSNHWLVLKKQNEYLITRFEEIEKETTIIHIYARQ